MNDDGITAASDANPLRNVFDQPGPLRTDPRIANPDEFYQLLLDAHRGLSNDQARKVTAKLLLLLGNHIGDIEVVRQAIAIARSEPQTKI
jgi:hypothetical protein